MNVHAFRALPASITDDELARFPPNTLAVLDRPGSSRKGRRANMSLMECIQHLRDLRDPDHVSGRGAAPSGEYVPPPKMTQAEFEREVYAMVKAGVIRPEGADHLLAGMARSAARKAQDGLPMESAAPAPLGEDAESFWEKRERLNRRLAEAGIEERYFGLRLHENPFRTEMGTPYALIEATEQAEGNARAFRAARRLAHDWEPGRPGLTLQSVDRGVSKTLLAAAVAVYVVAMKRGREPGRVAHVRFVRAGDLFGLFALSHRATWERNPGVVSTEQAWQRMAVRPDLLVIDDLGTEPWDRSDTGEWTREKFYQLADYRLSQKLTTVITTQLDAGALTARYGGHVCSRLLARSPLVSIAGSPDFRQDAVIDENDPFAD